MNVWKRKLHYALKSSTLKMKIIWVTLLFKYKRPIIKVCSREIAPAVTYTYVLDKLMCAEFEYGDSSIFTNQNCVWFLGYGVLFRTYLVRVAQECELCLDSLQDRKYTPKLKICGDREPWAKCNKPVWWWLWKTSLRFKKCVNSRKPWT